MLIRTRLQKSQIPSIYKFTANGSFTARDIALMYGYKNYEVLAVGAAGGRSGGYIHLGALYYVDPNGGGGGSSKIVSGLLSSLAASTAVVVGAQGSTGADGNEAISGGGGRGGNSSFGALVTGYGGYGATPVGPGAINSGYGQGGAGANPDGSSGPAGGYSPDPNAPSFVAPQNGSWNAANKEGSGGGGGFSFGAYSNQAGTGGTGAVGSGYDSAGENWNIPVPGTNQSSYYGGGGGGCNIAPFTGGAFEEYGAGWHHGRGGGVVVVKLS